MEEFDIDFDKLDDSLKTKPITPNISTTPECLNCSESKNDKFAEPKKAKKNLNMNMFARNLETKLDNFNNVDKIPEKLDTIKLNLSQNVKLSKISKQKEINKDESLLDQVKKQKDIIISVLLFILLNNKNVIEFIYDNFVFTRDINNPYYNLIIRTLLFAIILYVIKIYYY